MLTHLQSAALQAGDPAGIATASRELNAELLSLLGTIASGDGRLDDGASRYRQSLTFRDDPELRLRLAILLQRLGNTSEAIKVARGNTETEPGDARAFTTLATILRSANQDKAASEALTRALELDPNPSIAFALGSSLLASHDEVRAKQIFQRLLTASGGAAIWHVAVGDAYREAGFLDQAAAEFQAALKKDPRATHAEFFLGLVNLQRNEWGPNSESFVHLRKSVEQDPHEYLSNFYLGALESTDGSDLLASDRHLKAAAQADPTQPEVWIYLGQNANRERRSSDAIVYLRKAIQLTGKDEARNRYQIRRAYFTLGRLLIAQGDRSEGERLLADYKRTEKLDAASASATIAEKRDVSGAEHGEADTRVALSSVPVNAGVSVPGRSTLQQQELSAMPDLRSAESQLESMLGNSYNDLGTAEARQQRYAQALHDFQEAERWGAPSAQLLRNLASAAYRINDSAEVDRALTRYFEINPAPQDPKARLMLGMSQFDLGKFGPASKSFHAAGEAATTDSRVLYAYAFSLARIGQAQDANAMADRLVAMQLPTNLLALACHIYFDTENYESSASCYKRTVSEDATLLTAHYFVGESLIHIDRPAEAVPELQQELALTPNEPNVRSALAFALSQTSRKSEALALLESTVAMHPHHADSQYQLGKLLLEEDKVADAIIHLQAAESADATRDYTHYQLATAYRKAGRGSDSEREFSLYRQIKERRRNDRAVPETTNP